jgi:hypothetical protein
LGVALEMGFEDVMVRHIVGEHQRMLRSFALLGSHVLPVIRELYGNEGSRGWEIPARKMVDARITLL